MNKKEYNNKMRVKLLAEQEYRNRKLIYEIELLRKAVQREEL